MIYRIHLNLCKVDSALSRRAGRGRGPGGWRWADGSNKYLAVSVN